MRREKLFCKVGLAGVFTYRIEMAHDNSLRTPANREVVICLKISIFTGTPKLPNYSFISVTVLSSYFRTYEVHFRCTFLFLQYNVKQIIDFRKEAKKYVIFKL